MKPTPIVRILAVLAVVIGLLVLMATLANAQTVPATPASAAVQLTDDRGRQITLAHAPLRIVKIRRDYNSWVARETIEDYALRYTPVRFRRWSAMRANHTVQPP